MTDPIAARIVSEGRIGDTKIFIPREPEAQLDPGMTSDAAVLILSASPTDPRRLALAVARLPTSAVAEIRTVS